MSSVEAGEDVIDDEKARILSIIPLTEQSFRENGSSPYKKQCNEQPAAQISAPKTLYSIIFRSSSSPSSSPPSIWGAEVGETKASGGQKAIVPTVLETRPEGFKTRSIDAAQPKSDIRREPDE